MRNLLADLATIAGPANVLSDPELVAGYVTDWTRRYTGPASAVVRPGSTAELAAVVRACASNGVPIVPQGGNTSLVGGSVPMAEADQRSSAAPVIVSTRRLTELQPVDQLSASVIAGAGVTIAQLRDHAARAGYRYGVDLASRQSATVGGTIATNAGGIHTIRYGSTRTQLIGLTAVLAAGQVIDTSLATAPVTAGYDLVSLLAGSEGTLGVITAARLRLWPVEPVAAVLLVGVAGIEPAARSCRQFGQVAGLLAAEYFDAAALDVVCRVTGLRPPLAAAYPGYLLVELTGEPDLTGLDLPDDVAVGLDRSDQAALWAYRERLTEAIATAGRPHKIDVSVPITKLGDFRSELTELVRTTSGGSAALIVFGHLGVGNLHVNILDAAPDDTAVDAAVARLAASYGGSVAAEHGIGRAKASWLGWSRSGAELAAMRAVKGALDPAGLLNPGVLLPTVDR